MDTLNDVVQRLGRMETRMMRGFEELGVDVRAQPGWLVVNKTHETITITSPHHSIASIAGELARQGVEYGHGRYRVMCGDRVLCRM